MIKSVEIQNFQSHKKTVLKFDSGVNVIIGKSDVGKSAIIRALKWCIFNTPRGDGFRSSFGGDTSVKITLDDGQTIERIRTNTQNKYILNSESEFNALNGKVPEEIENILKFTNVNLQNQF